MRKVLLALPIAALLLSTMGVSTAFAAATTWVVDDDGAAVAGNCADSTSTFATIPAAVAAATTLDGDIIVVCPGNYNDGQIVVNKSLTIRGSNRGNSGESCTSRGNESRVFSSAGPGGTGAFWLQADNVIINGFLIEDNAGPGIQTDNAFSGYTIRNNIIRNNVMGLYFQANPAGKAIRSRVLNNCFQSNNVGSSPANGNGIYTDAGLRHATIFSNTFLHNENSGIFLFSDSTAALKAKNVNIVSNLSIDDITFLAIFNGHGIYVEANRVVNATQAFANPGSAIYIGGGSDLGIGTGSNAVTLSNNNIDSTHFAGIAIRGSADNIVVLGNVISHTDRGIDVNSDAVGAAMVHLNRITNVNEYGLSLRGLAQENQVSNNTVSGSGVLDCNDVTSGPDTLGTDNHWVNNSGATNFPLNLCRI